MVATRYLGCNLSFWRILGVLGNWCRLCPFDMIFSANGSVFRAEHDPLLRTTYFLSKTRVLRVRKRCSTLKLKARYICMRHIRRSFEPLGRLLHTLYMRVTWSVLGSGARSARTAVWSGVYWKKHFISESYHDVYGEMYEVKRTDLVHSSGI